jgi:hypothetical protein
VGGREGGRKGGVARAEVYFICHASVGVGGEGWNGDVETQASRSTRKRES